MRDLPDVLNVGYQTAPIYNESFGTDWHEGKCWLCRKNETRDPMETCEDCREELR